MTVFDDKPIKIKCSKRAAQALMDMCWVSDESYDGYFETSSFTKTYSRNDDDSVTVWVSPDFIECFLINLNSEHMSGLGGSVLKELGVNSCVLKLASECIDEDEDANDLQAALDADDGKRYSTQEVLEIIERDTAKSGRRMS